MISCARRVAALLAELLRLLPTCEGIIRQKQYYLYFDVQVRSYHVVHGAAQLKEYYQSIEETDVNKLTSALSVQAT